MPSGTIFKPLNINEFTADVLNYAADAVSAVCTPNTTTTIDYTVSDDVMFTGLQAITDNGNYGDYVVMQIVDINNIMGLGAGAVLLQPIKKWFMPPVANMQYDVVYPAKIYTGLTIRVIYTSTSLAVSPFVALNYKLHKVLK